MTIGIVYLARKAEGMNSFRRFITSHQAFQPNIPYGLIIVLKGFENDPTAEAEARSIFDRFGPRYTKISDDHFDIGAYLLVALQHDDEAFCFLNTHTVITSHGWLTHLYEALTRPGVGLVGAFGSYESLYSSTKLMAKVEWLAAHMKVPFDAQLAEHYHYLLKERAPDWLRNKNGRRLRLIHGAHYPKFIEQQWLSFWEELTAPGGSQFYIRNFPPFPHPHIRSNGFMLRRSDLVRRYPGIEPTKIASYNFESGIHSLTNQIKHSGQRVLVVDRNGETYEEKEWPRSNTFRVGTQAGLMMGDNQTRAFEAMSEPERITHVMMTWGDHVTETGYNLGIDFSWEASHTPPIPHFVDHLDYGVNYKLKNDHDPVWGHEVHCWPPK
jgi:hypothetical protein